MHWKIMECQKKGHFHEKITEFCFSYPHFFSISEFILQNVFSVPLVPAFVFLYQPDIWLLLVTDHGILFSVLSGNPVLAEKTGKSLIDTIFLIFSNWTPPSPLFQNSVVHFFQISNHIRENMEMCRWIFKDATKIKNGRQKSTSFILCVQKPNLWREIL